MQKAFKTFDLIGIRRGPNLRPWRPFLRAARARILLRVVYEEHALLDFLTCSSDYRMNHRYRLSPLVPMANARETPSRNSAADGKVDCEVHPPAQTEAPFGGSGSCQKGLAARKGFAEICRADGIAIFAVSLLTRDRVLVPVSLGHLAVTLRWLRSRGTASEPVRKDQILLPLTGWS